MQPNVLIGYSCDDVTRQAFADAGCVAYTCDLLPSRGASQRWHIQDDIWNVVLSYRWNFALLHPMCTFLTTSAAWAFKDGPYHQKVKPGTLVGLQRRAARWQAQLNFAKLLTLPFPVVVENPATNFINKFLRGPDQIINPFEFGDDASKATGLWRSPGVPALIIDPKHYCKPRLVCDDCRSVFSYGKHRCPVCTSERYKPRWSNQTDSGQNRLTPSDDRWLDRSETYPGIANALGTQYGHWLNNRG